MIIDNGDKAEEKELEMMRNMNGALNELSQEDQKEA